MSEVLAEILKPADRQADAELFSKAAIEASHAGHEELAYLFLVFCGRIAIEERL